MAHKTSKNYINLQERLDMSPQGAPASDSLFKILEILFTEKEAKLVSVLPINLFQAKKAAKIWKTTEEEAVKVLNGLADKGILFDLKRGEENHYILVPTMAGFFEFSLMRTDGKFDRKILSELFHQYINVEEDFLIRVLGSNPNIARTLVHEDKIQEKDFSEVLDYEKASNVIDTASCITVGTCYCRHKMEHMGKACDKPQNVCLTFNHAATSLSKHGVAKEISKKEAHKILDKCVKLGLVQIGDNVQNKVGWICNCCGCCCEALLAYKHLGYNMKIHSNFVSVVNAPDCIGCGICVKKCPVDAMKMDKKKKVVVIDEKSCIGCGVCTRFCPKTCLKMDRRKELNFTPVDSFDRFVRTAMNQGRLQNLIFDNRSLWTHNMLRRFLKFIFELGPAKRAIANHQLQSRFIGLITKLKYNK
ncbi:4Fe-4S dicluster domain-containing protein [Candidatus Woesearchaeota archaeon]|nr:4Fe-4S dicluster domain-containing protein [Candidatus Woesearchaeota archaeon]